MMSIRSRRCLSFVCAVVLAGGGALAAARQAATSSRASEVDRIFAKWTTSTPGCAVGVGVGGTPGLEKAYGLADLEHDAPHRPDSIFEACSVSKQFTAAAMLLLATEGKLSFDDP